MYLWNFEVILKYGGQAERCFSHWCFLTSFRLLFIYNRNIYFIFSETHSPALCIERDHNSHGGSLYNMFNPLKMSYNYLVLYPRLTSSWNSVELHCGIVPCLKGKRMACINLPRPLLDLSRTKGCKLVHRYRDFSQFNR